MVVALLIVELLLEASLHLLPLLSMILRKGSSLCLGGYEK